MTRIFEYIAVGRMSDLVDRAATQWPDGPIETIIGDECTAYAMTLHLAGSAGPDLSQAPVRPAYDNVLIDIDAASAAFRSSLVKPNDSNLMEVGIGVLLETRPVDDTQPEALRELSQRGGWDPEQATHVVRSTIIFESKYARGRAWIAPYCAMMFLDERGFLLNQDFIGVFLRDPNFAGEGPHTEQASQQLTQQWTSAALFTCQSMHAAKTVVTERETPGRPFDILNKRPAVPSLTFRTLHVPHITKALERAAEHREHGGGVLPLHGVRGHYVTYTEEAPMFGKHVGTFWKDPHMRGKVENGAVVKHYSVEPTGTDA